MSKKTPIEPKPYAPTQWETRYSSAEMMYLEVTSGGVRAYLNQNVGSADRWTLEEARDGGADYMVRSVFGDETLAELHAAIQARLKGL